MKQPKIIQFSFVVDDLDEAIKHWASNLHTGPFFVADHISYTQCYFRGESSDIDMSVAIAYHGDLQIELVQQHNDAPSIFTEFRSTRGSGLQHVAAVSTNLNADLKTYSARGYHPIQQGSAGNGTLFAYIDTPDNPVPGTMLELVQLPDVIVSAFDYMKRAAETWNPDTDPYRR